MANMYKIIEAIGFSYISQTISRSQLLSEARSTLQSILLYVR